MLSRSFGQKTGILGLFFPFFVLIRADVIILQNRLKSVLIFTYCIALSSPYVGIGKQIKKIEDKCLLITLALCGKTIMIYKKMSVCLCYSPERTVWRDFSTDWPSVILALRLSLLPERSC